MQNSEFFYNNKTYKLLSIIGPTASGKSSLAHNIADKFLQLSSKLQIISCDSVAVYKGLDIGSAKPTYREQEKYNYRLVDICDPTQRFDAGQFANLAVGILDQNLEQGIRSLCVGGTGLYLRALFGDRFHENLPVSEKLRQQLELRSGEILFKILNRLDPQRASEIHPHDHYRIKRAIELRVMSGKTSEEIYKSPMNRNQLREQTLLVYIKPTRDVLHQNIEKRVDIMFEQGLIEEVTSLLHKGITKEHHSLKTIGYRECCEYLEGKFDKSLLREKIIVSTRQFAKRQMTWFNKMNVDVLLSTSDEVSCFLDKISNS